MNDWSTAQVGEEFERCFAGFDVRAALSVSAWKPATIDSSIWPRLITTEQDRDCNGLNLFPSEEKAKVVSKHLSQAHVVVGFDFPTTLIDRIAGTFGLSSAQATRQVASAGWQFLGFDVADVRTQSSGFYSFDWAHLEWMEFVISTGAVFNRFGLLDTAEPAIECARALDSRIMSHAPFAPCGVWIVSQ